MDFKDAKAVLDLWGQTSPGDWEADTYNFCVKCPDWGIAQIYYDDDDRPCDETESFYSVADTVFTAIAHQALPYWVQEAERLREENEKLLKAGTIAFNALFLLNQNLAMNNQIKDDRCQQCSKTKDFPLPVFIKCTLCQFERWMDKGKEMYEDPETKAWAEADTPEKIISLVFKNDGLEG